VRAAVDVVMVVVVVVVAVTVTVNTAKYISIRGKAIVFVRQGK